MKISRAKDGFLRLDDLTPKIKKSLKLVVPQQHLIDVGTHMFVKDSYLESVQNVVAHLGHTVSWVSSSRLADLHLTNDAPRFLIRSAWKALAAHYHPDKPTGDSEKFEKYKKAYEDLTEE